MGANIKTNYTGAAAVESRAKGFSPVDIIIIITRERDQYAHAERVVAAVVAVTSSRACSSDVIIPLPAAAAVTGSPE